MVQMGFPFPFPLAFRFASRFGPGSRIGVRDPFRARVGAVVRPGDAPGIRPGNPWSAHRTGSV